MSRLDSDVTLYICNVCLFYKTLPLDLCAFLEKLYSPALSVLRNIVYQYILSHVVMDTFMFCSVTSQLARLFAL